MAPLLVKENRVNYILWQTQDSEGLVSDLPDIHNGASKWKREFEEKTQEKSLAIGNVKAVLARMIRREDTIRILREADIQNLYFVDTAQEDRTEFDPFRNLVWTELR